MAKADSSITCRLCMDTVEQALNISITCDDGIDFTDKVVTIFRIELDKASNPLDEVCHDCFMNVCDFYAYYHQVRRNNKHFTGQNVLAKSCTNPSQQPFNDCDSPEKSPQPIYYEVIEGEAETLKDSDKSGVFDGQESENDDDATCSQSLEVSSSPHFSQARVSTEVSRQRGDQLRIDLPDHLKKRISKANGDAKIKEFIEMNCTLCGPKLPAFDTFKDMQLHYEKEHHTKGYLICCGKKIYRKDRVMDHITVHINPNAFKCPMCNHRSKSRVLLRIHMKQHLPTEEWPFACEKCNQRFVLKSQLTNHEATHLNDAEKKFVCDECGKVFALKFVLIKHKQTHSRERKFFCEICAKAFSSQACLSSHVKHHETTSILDPRVQCETCGQWYKNRQTLRTHERRHRDTRNHICEICSRECSSKSSLSAHIRYVHMRTSQFECSVCMKHFRRKPELTEHMARHTGEVLYKCSFCSKTFYSSSNFFAHRKSKHPAEYRELLKKMSPNA